MLLAMNFFQINKNHPGPGSDSGQTQRLKTGTHSDKPPGAWPCLTEDDHSAKSQLPEALSPHQDSLEQLSPPPLSGFLLLVDLHSDTDRGGAGGCLETGHRLTLFRMQAQGEGLRQVGSVVHPCDF